MAKKQRFEQIEGLPEALENKADKADVVPYEGATQNVNLEDKSLQQRGFTQFSFNTASTHGGNSGIRGYWRLNLGSSLQYGCYFDLKFSGGYNSYNSSGIIGIRGHLKPPYIYEVYTARGNVKNDLYFEPELFQDEDGIFFLKIWKRRSGNIHINLSGIIAVKIDDVNFEFIEDDTPVSESNSSYLLDYNNFYNTPNLSDYALQSWVNSNFATTNEINNIYDQLSAKANDRLSNVAYDLSDVEKSDIKYKIGIEKTSNYLDTDHLNNYGSGFFSGLVVDYSFFSGGIQEPDGKLYISALAEDGSYKELDKDVTQFSRHVVTQVGVSNVLVAEGIIKTSYSLTDFSKKSRDIYLVVLYNDTGATPLWRSISHIKEIRASFEGTAWLIGKLFIADNVVFFNVYPQII